MGRHSRLNPNTPESEPDTFRVTILDEQMHALEEIARERGVEPDPEERITTEVLDVLIEEYVGDREGFEGKSGLIQYSSRD